MTNQYMPGSPSVKIQRFDGATTDNKLYSPWSFTLNTGEMFEAFIIQPRCLLPPSGLRFLLDNINSKPSHGLHLKRCHLWLTGTFDSVVNGSETINATADGQLYVNTSASTGYQFRHHIALPMSGLSIPNVCPLFEGSFILRATTGSQATNVYLGAGLLSTVPANTTEYISIENTCPAFEQIPTDLSSEWVWGYAIYNISTSHPIEVNAYDVLALPKISTLKFTLYDTLLNEALNASYTGDDRAMLDLPFMHKHSGEVSMSNLRLKAHRILLTPVVDAPASRWLQHTT